MRDLGSGIGAPWRAAAAPRRRIPEAEAEAGLVVELADGGFCGAVVAVEKAADGRSVTLEDRHGRRRGFPLGHGFLVDGEPVVLVAPHRSAPAATGRTASGSVAVAGHRARVARAARIYVEGRHDAELVERVWGDDLRIKGVVVEQLDGVDRLPDVVAAFRPGPGRRLGVLVDHLVAGSKEARVAATVAGPHVLVVGHPYVDVWAAVRPASVGIAAWPDVPRDEEWKRGVLDRLGWDVPTHEAWRRILSRVCTYADLEPALLGRVEEVIDFITGG